MSHTARRTLSARATFAALSLVGALASTSADATVVVLHSLEEMSRRSDVVMHARVGDVRVMEREGRVATVVDLEVLDGWKGIKAGEVVQLFQLGGVLGQRREHIVGQHQWQVGEEVVLFAMRYQDGLISYGVGVGKRLVDRSSGSPTVVEVFGDVAAMERDDTGNSRIVHPTAGTPIDLAVLRQDVVAFASKGQLGVGEPFVKDGPTLPRKPSFEIRGKKPTGGL